MEQDNKTPYRPDMEATDGNSKPVNDGIVVIRLPRSEKGEWVRQSRKEGMKLVEWIRMRCRGDQA